MQARKELLTDVRALYGPSSKEVGEMIADNVRLWRWKRAHRILQRAAEFRKSNSDTNSPIPLKFFLPFIEEASKEDDEELSDWWARLLSSSAETTVGFDLVCVDVLKSMGRTEAEFLLRMSKYRFPEWDELEWDVDQIRSKLHGYDGDPVSPEITNIIEAAETTLSTAKLVEFLEEHVKIFVIRTYYKGIPDWDRGQFSQSDRRSFEALRRLGLLGVEVFYFSDERNYL